MKKIIEVVKWLLALVAGILAVIFASKVIKEFAQIGNIDRPKNWSPVDDKNIVIYDESGNIEKKIILPKDPETNKQITVDNIKAVGIIKGGDKIHVEIKHKIINRRGPVNGSVSNNP